MDFMYCVISYIVVSFGFVSSLLQSFVFLGLVMTFSLCGQFRWAN